MVSNLNIRERTEEREERLLSPLATKSRFSRGRAKWEEPCPVRTCFQRDRDRIIHSKAFRRLKHKTQVFIAPFGDHYVTRLTHTLEVSQIARTIARALNLNEDLAEAISLGHDLGHTPFGHLGEEALNELSSFGFKHNEQSLRVVDVLENDGKGLNLTWEVREGILKHSKSREDLLGEGELPHTLEGQVCRLADVIAYINHDIGDALRARLIVLDELPQDALNFLGRTHRERVNTLVCDVIASSWSVAGGNAAQPSGSTIQLSRRAEEALSSLREFLFERVYDVQKSKGQWVKEVLERLYHYFMRHPEKLPREFLRPEEGVERAVVDYIAGMSDQYALRFAEEIGLNWIRQVTAREGILL
ncbi:MAG: deoxyguanosinetriphosphate triphosphohydrolase [Chloroflexi bacterium]|nr:MAG: deoxyguanosinetriphosphate triphosphohydrolase [Chloroflexota bacterium]